MLRRIDETIANLMKPCIRTVHAVLFVALYPSLVVVDVAKAHVFKACVEIPAQRA